MWCPCVGEMNVLACSYHCWFPARLNGQCSGAVRMNDWPQSSHDNFLPTHCSNPPPGPLIWLLLILSLSFPRFLFLPLYTCLSLSLSLRSVYPGQEDQAGGDGWLPQQPTTWQAKWGERWPQPWTGWVLSVCPSTHVLKHTHVCASEMFNHGRITRCTVVVCEAKSIRLEQLCLCAAAESSWLKPGCDITSSACAFPLRDSECKAKKKKIEIGNKHWFR